MKEPTGFTLFPSFWFFFSSKVPLLCHGLYRSINKELISNCAIAQSKPLIHDKEFWKTFTLVDVDVVNSIWSFTPIYFFYSYLNCCQVPWAGFCIKGAIQIKFDLIPYVPYTHLKSSKKAEPP